MYVIPTVKQLMNQLVQNCCWLETTAEWFIKVTSWVQLKWIDGPYIALLDAQRLITEAVGPEPQGSTGGLVDLGPSHVNGLLTQQYKWQQPNVSDQN